MSYIKIDIEDVSFGYEKGAEILSHISLHATESDSIGLIGANESIPGASSIPTVLQQVFRTLESSTLTR